VTAGASNRIAGLDTVRAGERASYVAAQVIIGLAILLLLAELIVRLQSRTTEVVFNQGIDYRTYVDAARRWLAGGSFYEPYQLAGPYPIVSREILYPPIMLVLLVPFTVLPALLWWAIPLSITTWLVAWHRPSVWGCAAICGLLILPVPFMSELAWSLGTIVSGNPAMWVVAAVAAGTRWGWPAVLVLLKPSLLPFALIGIRTGRWWVAAVLLTTAAAVFLPLWIQYATVLLNARGPSATLLYSLGNVPLMLVPVVAWLTRTRPVGRVFRWSEPAWDWDREAEAVRSNG
jgi:hypothetical protein